jgi:hypothetical protein
MQDVEDEANSCLLRKFLGARQEEGRSRFNHQTQFDTEKNGLNEAYGGNAC